MKADNLRVDSMKAGDLIGFSHWGLSGILINVGSYGIPFVDLSHIGILADFNGALCLYESTTLMKEPCLYAGTRIKGAQVHDLKTRVANYRGIVYHIPLAKEIDGAKLRNFLFDDLGKPYDTLGAMRSGLFAYAWANKLLRSEDLNNLFCSEWIMAALRRVKVFEDYNISSYSPNASYRYLLNRGLVLPRQVVTTKSIRLESPFQKGH